MEQIDKIYVLSAYEAVIANMLPKSLALCF